MPEAPAATPVLSTTSTSSPALARCQAVDSPWTPAPITRCLTEEGTEGGTGISFECCLSRNGIAVLLGTQTTACRRSRRTIARDCDGERLEAVLPPGCARR